MSSSSYGRSAKRPMMMTIRISVCLDVRPFQFTAFRQQPVETDPRILFDGKRDGVSDNIPDRGRRMSRHESGQLGLLEFPPTAGHQVAE